MHVTQKVVNEQFIQFFIHQNMLQLIKIFQSFWARVERLTFDEQRQELLAASLSKSEIELEVKTMEMASLWA